MIHNTTKSQDFCDATKKYTDCNRYVMVMQIYFPHLNLKFCFTEAEDPVPIKKANQNQHIKKKQPTPHQKKKTENKQTKKPQLNPCLVLYDTFFSL